MYQTVHTKWYFLMTMFIVHRKRYQAEEASRILDPLLSVYHLWCDWMSMVRERGALGSWRSPARRQVVTEAPEDGRSLARPVAVAVSPHCWSWFIPHSRPPEQGGLTPPPSMITTVAASYTAFSRTVSRKLLRRPNVSLMFGKSADLGEVAIAQSVWWLATGWMTGIQFLVGAEFFSSLSRLFNSFGSSVSPEVRRPGRETDLSSCVKINSARSWL